MFSYTGLTAAQVERMKDEFGIYAVGTGRICLAALNTKNLDYVADAIAAVIKAKPLHPPRLAGGKNAQRP
jgi:aromatic-amino-acid transaminase